MEESTMRTLFSTEQLGTSQLQIARIGFGAWASDGGWSFGWGPENDGDSTAAIRRALHLGNDWIDTAGVYSLRNPEAGCEFCDLIGDDRPYVFTKCGLIWDEGGRAREPRRSQWPASIRNECEQALRHLGVERVDLFQLHSPDEDGTRIDDSLNATKPTCAAHRTGLMWYSPSQADLLTEAFSRARKLASAVAVAWTLTSQGVAQTIVGASASEQVESWVDAATLVLWRANLGEIATAIGRTSAGHSQQLPTALAA
jgi:aryl-alcohol dehydrogenase-like predicted oxidoreductase